MQIIYSSTKLSPLYGCMHISITWNYILYYVYYVIYVVILWKLLSIAKQHPQFHEFYMVKQVLWDGGGDKRVLEKTHVYLNSNFKFNIQCMDTIQASWCRFLTKFCQKDLRCYKKNGSHCSLTEDHTIITQLSSINYFSSQLKKITLIKLGNPWTTSPW